MVVSVRKQGKHGKEGDVMRCPYCGKADSRVVDSRAADEGATIRRRRECTGCGRRFTTYEVVEKVPLMVIKNDGRREPFKQEKLLNGLIRSCEKRDIPMERIVRLANEIEREVRNTMEREIPSKKLDSWSWITCGISMRWRISALPLSIASLRISAISSQSSMSSASRRRRKTEPAAPGGLSF